MSETTASAKAAEKEKTGPNTRRSGGQRSSADPSFNMEELRELAALVDEHGFTDFEFENENIRVRLSKMTSTPVVQAAPVYAPVRQTSQTAPAGSAETSAAAPQAETDENLHKITSPIVGTFYASPSPQACGSSSGPSGPSCPAALWGSSPRCSSSPPCSAC